MRLPRLSCLSALQATPAGQRIAPVIVVIDEGADLRFECTRQEVVFEQDAVLQCLVPSLDLTLDLGMVGRATRVLDALICKPGCQITSDVTWAIVG